MSIYRWKGDGCLYKIYKVSPRMYTGSWYEAEPLFSNKGKKIKNAKLQDFTLVSGCSKRFNKETTTFALDPDFMHQLDKAIKLYGVNPQLKVFRAWCDSLKLNP